MEEYRELTIGESAPLFTLPDKEGEKFSLAGHKGSWVVLYFYPKDDTPGCTTEARDFSVAMEEFTNKGAVILGISPDSPKSHEKFTDKYDIKITLLSDETKEVMEKYGVWRKKKMYGKEYWGVYRSTFLINPEGKITHIWYKVKVDGHVDEVKRKLTEFIK
jgi:peroxiredoxin Q/BCP